ncbi:MAG: four helix bundle protein [Hyphomicrobiaceae bacterium]|nr:four helix bundle protein [Hyphomicrobiaceae bacterium]
MRIESHRDLIAWKKGMELAASAYRLAKQMPRSEEFRLTSQLLRSAVSVPANIAEGHARATRRDYAHFVAISRGSVAEAETLLLLAVDVSLLRPDQAQPALALCTELSKMLTALLGRLREQSSN